jgi:hypothetical protein
VSRSTLLKGSFAALLLAIVVGGETVRNMTVCDTRAIIHRNYDACNVEDCREQIVAEASERIKGPQASLKDVEILNKRIADLNRRMAD